MKCLSISVAMFALLFLCGCPPVTLQTQTLKPNLVQTLVELHPVALSACSSGCLAPNQNLWGVEPPGLTCVNVGFNNAANTFGACASCPSAYLGASYYGQVGFPLSSFNGKGLVSAVLKFEHVTQPISRSAGCTGVSVPGNASALSLIEFWDGKGGSPTRIGNGPQTIITVTPSTSPYLSFDVSVPLRQRLIANKNDTAPTTFYLVGDPSLTSSLTNDPTRTLGKQLFSSYRNFTLEIVFNPDQ